MGSRILAGRYELLDKIGEGGMAVVFKSRDRLLNRNVAIKILRPEFTKDAVFIESFRRESQTAASLIHPNIVNVFDVGQEGNIYYIVMELIEGSSLSDVIKNEAPLEPHRAATIAKQIASALSLAHKNNLIHRDVKPHNIMLTSEGVAKITDFGIAKAVSSDTFVGDKQETVMGSVHYFSPEQARGGYVDEKSDIYSLGIVLFEMLTGRVPFDGETAVEVAVKHMNESVPSPRKFNEDIPEDLETIVLRATDKVPANRYKSMDDMIMALNFVKYAKSYHPYVAAEASAAAAAAAAAAANEEAKPEETPEHGIFGLRRKDRKHKAEEVVDEPEEELSAQSEPEQAPVYEETPARETYEEPDYSDYDEDDDDDDDEDDEPEKERKFFHPIRYIAVLLAVLLAVPFSAAAYNFLADKTAELNDGGILDTGKNAVTDMIGKKTPTTIEVPEWTNKSITQVQAEAKELGLNIEVDMAVSSNTYEAGTVLSQKTSAGAKVKPGATIHVNVSKGKADGKAPNVVGKTLADAKNIIKSYGYAVGHVSEEFSEKIPEGYIISQSPKAGSTLEANGKVSMVLSLGPEDGDDLTLDLTQVDYELAVEIIESRELVLGIVSYEPNEEVPENCVISQDPEAGSEVVKGTTVNLVVSTGNPNAPIEGEDPEGQEGENPEGQEGENNNENQGGENNNENQGGESNNESQGGENTTEPEMVIDGTVSITVFYDAAETDDFLLTVNVTDSNGSRAFIRQASRNKSAFMEILNIPGGGSNGKIVVFFGNDIVAQYSADFKTGSVTAQ